MRNQSRPPLRHTRHTQKTHSTDTRHNVHTMESWPLPEVHGVCSVGQNRNLGICTGAVRQVPYEDRREKVIRVGRHSRTPMNGGSAGSGGGTDSSQQVRPLHYLGTGYHSSRVAKPSDYHEGRGMCVLLSQAPQPPPT